MSDDQSGTIPPNGWETPDSEDVFSGELDALLALVGQLLAAAPDEIRLRMTQAARALLQALRALLDWLALLLSGGEPGEAGARVAVHDIPIL